MKTYSIQIEKLAYGGEGIGHLAGKIFFVEGALPGETVEAKITQDKKSFGRAKTVKIINPSPTRITPVCPHEAVCGGCQYQHVTYAEELRWKQIQVEEYLQKNLKLSKEIFHPIVHSTAPYHYRSSVTLHPAKTTAGEIRNGFIGKDNSTAIPIEQCFLLDEKFSDVWKEKLFDSAKAKSLTLRLNHERQQVKSSENTLFQIQVGENKIQTHSKGFFQNNLEITKLIAGQVKAWTEQISPHAFIDLFSGCGTFSLLSAQSVPRIICAEENPYSLEALNVNFENTAKSVEILEGKAEEIFPLWLNENTPDSALLFLDPPRDGMHPKLARLISKQEGIKNIIYLSCHLGSLTRDLKEILSGENYKISAVIPFDMFPRTQHIEILTLLDRN